MLLNEATIEKGCLLAELINEIENKIQGSGKLIVKAFKEKKRPDSEERDTQREVMLCKALCYLSGGRV